MKAKKTQEKQAKKKASPVAAAPPDEQPTKQPSGAAKMKAAGKRGIMLAVTPEQYALFESAASADYRKLSPWIVKTCLDAVKK